MKHPPCDVYRFDRFEAQVRTGHLLRGGKRVRIEELPFRMLVVLLETPGQVVSREDLRDRLWGDRTFGEFDNGLHVAAAKLREALGDNASQPRFIETVRRRGYRFIGQVEQVFEEPATVPSEPDSKEPIALSEVSSAPELVPATLVATARSVLRGRKRLLISAIAAGAVLLAAGIFVYGWYAHRPLAGNQDRIAVGSFSNSTGDDVYSRILASAFRVKLNESPYLNLIPDRQFRRELKSTATESPGLADELRACAIAKGQILLRGNLKAQSQGYQVQLSAWRCSNRNLLVTEHAHADAGVNILSALDDAAKQMRRRLGESEDSLDRFNVPLALATTASLTALDAFTQGEEKRANEQEVKAISDYQLAVDLDPQFALAYARLGTVYSNAGEYELSRRYYQKAFDLREHTTDRERLYIAAHYYSSATGEIQRAIDAYELWRSVYPHDMTPLNNLADEYIAVGKPEKSIGLALEAIHADPAAKLPYATLALAYLRSGNYQALGKLCQDPAYHTTDIMPLHNACYLLAFVRQDEAGMQRELDMVHGNPAESELLDEAAWAAMYRGRIAEAHRLFSAAEQSAHANHLDEFAIEIELDEANLEADLGYVKAAEDHVHHALQNAGDSAEMDAYGALALAQVGDIAGAEAEGKKLQRIAPKDTILNSVVLASAQALAAIRRHDAATALVALERVHPLDFCSEMELAPAYYRGLAYLEAGRPVEAKREFQSVVDHRALAPDSPYVPLALLKEGRVFQHSGDRENAAHTYQMVADIWKNADADFPPRAELERARLELAAMR